MPCTAPVRGKTDTLVRWSDWTDNDPCGKEDYLAGLCKLHWQKQYGLVATTAVADPYTVFLLHCDGPDGSTTLTDVKGHPITVFGDARIATIQSVFGGASLSLDGTDDKLTTPDSADWYFAAGDFTIDFRVRFNQVLAGRYFIGQYDGAGSQRGWGIYMNTSTSLQIRLAATPTDGTSLTFAWAPSPGVWYHVALVRSANTVMCFIDGVQIGTPQAFTATLYDSTAPLMIGAVVDITSGSEFNGSLDEIRISKGIARWMSNFTPPTAPYS